MEGRSYQPILTDDLARLSEIAEQDRDQFLQKRPEYSDRLLCVALCQGAGMHFVDLALGVTQPTGIKDFDVWSFFASISGKKFPADRRNTHEDFGRSKFGRWPDEMPRFRHFVGRRVDLFMRGLPVNRTADPAEAVRAWLHEAQTKSARLLSKKGVVVLDPESARGRIIWPLRMALL